TSPTTTRLKLIHTGLPIHIQRNQPTKAIKEQPARIAQHARQIQRFIKPTQLRAGRNYTRHPRPVIIGTAIAFYDTSQIEFARYHRAYFSARRSCPGWVTRHTRKATCRRIVLEHLGITFATTYVTIVIARQRPHRHKRDEPPVAGHTRGQPAHRMERKASPVQFVLG